MSMDEAGTLRAFERDMASIYDQAKAIGYNASRFLVMIREHGGLETAHRLVASADVSYGFGELWLLNRQDLTVEAHILDPKYRHLFSEDELRTARERLGTHAARFENPGSGSAGSSEAAPRWTVESYVAAASGKDLAVRAVIERFAGWLARHPGAGRLGSGEFGPMYFAPLNSAGTQVPLVSVNLNGRLEFLFDSLKKEAPFDKVASRIELQRRLNRILGIEVRDLTVEAGTWQDMDSAYLLSPGAFDEFAEACEWVALCLATGRDM